jgi:ArsR family transcriptional regulator
MADSNTKEYFRLHAQVCSSIAHPKRLEIISILRDDERSVSELAEEMQAAPANVSQQLAVLRNNGIVLRRMEGTTARYRIANRKVIRALDLMKEVLEGIVQQRLASLNVKKRGNK